MGIYIKGMEMPDGCFECPLNESCIVYLKFDGWKPITVRAKDCPLVEVPEQHGDLIDRAKLSSEMYHEAFETDTDLQRWDSGCWVRFKMFEDKCDSAPAIIEAEGE